MPTILTLTTQAMQSAIAALSQPSTLLAAAHTGGQMENIRWAYAPSTFAVAQLGNETQEPTREVVRGMDSNLHRAENYDEQQDDQPSRNVEFQEPGLSQQRARKFTDALPCAVEDLEQRARNEAPRIRQKTVINEFESSHQARNEDLL
ncbi:hypothetical protein FGB62_107g09 [Gracilaria domingensis]|nr:hypothetical protein FGB62_107g09 [Gracilaria domingensis]